MLSKNDELYLKLQNTNETDHQYLVRLLEEKTEYYKERITQYEQTLADNQYRGNTLMVKQVNQYLEMFKKLFAYNQNLTDKIR